MREGFELGNLLFRYQDAPAKRVPKDFYFSPVYEVIEGCLWNPKTYRCGFNRQHKRPENLYGQEGLIHPYYSRKLGNMSKG